jgi:copper chaperone CopZ
MITKEIAMLWRPMLVGFAAIVLFGCTQANNESIELTPAAFVAANDQVVEFSVPDMFCMEGCGATVRDVLAKQPGAKDVLVDFDHKTAIVAVEPGKFDPDAAVAALVDKMFPNSKLKSDDGLKPSADATVQ